MIIRNEQIESLLSSRREQARIQGEKKRDDIYERYPSLKELDKNIQVSRSDILLQVVSSPGKKPDYKNLYSLETRRRLFLQGEGISEDFSEPVSFCALCRDTGTTGEELCSCYKELLIPVLIQEGGLSDYKEMTFSQYSDEYYSDSDNMSLVRKLCDEYVLGFPGQHKSNLFLGKPGTGKTFLALCIANEVVRKGIPVFFVRMNELLDIMNMYRIQMMSFSPDAELLLQLMKKREMIFGADLLVIDELGVEAKGPNTTADLLEVLGNRRIKKLSTLITSNLTAADLQKNYDNRLYSRLFGDFSLVPFSGQDIRLHPTYKKR